MGYRRYVLRASLIILSLSLLSLALQGCQGVDDTSTPAPAAEETVGGATDGTAGPAALGVLFSTTVISPVQINEGIGTSISALATKSSAKNPAYDAECKIMKPDGTMLSSARSGLDGKVSAVIDPSQLGSSCEVIFECQVGKNKLRNYCEREGEAKAGETVECNETNMTTTIALQYILQQAGTENPGPIFAQKIEEGSIKPGVLLKIVRGLLEDSDAKPGVSDTVESLKAITEAFSNDWREAPPLPEDKKEDKDEGRDQEDREGMEFPPPEDKGVDLPEKDRSEKIHSCTIDSDCEPGEKCGRGYGRCEKSPPPLPEPAQGPNPHQDPGPAPVLTGEVRDFVTGLPIPNARIFFYGSAYGFTSTDENGEYTFTAGDLDSFGGSISGNLYVGATGYFEAKSVYVSDLSKQSSLPVVTDFSLEPGGPVIRGVVRDVSTGQGIAGATATFSRGPMSTFLGGATEHVVKTGSDGSYAIDSSYFNESGLSSGFTAYLEVNASGYLGATQSVKFSGSDYPVTRDFSLRSTAGPVITGEVRDRETDRPVPNARIFFYGSAYGTVFTNANGGYAFTAGDLSSFGGAISGNLYVGATGYFEAKSVYVSDLSKQSSLPVAADFSLEPAGSVIRGVVRDTSTGQGIAGATVIFSRSPMSTFLGGATEHVVKTGSDGSYEIDSSFFNESGLSDGGDSFFEEFFNLSGFSAYLKVNADGYLGATQSVKFSGSDYPVTRDFSLVSSTGPLITGVVRDRETDRPIANARIFFYGSAYGFTSTDDNGEYAFTAGVLNSFGGSISGNLYVGATGYFEAKSVYVSNLSKQPSLPVVNDFSLKPGGAVIQGVVREDFSPGRRGIAGATVIFSRSPMSTFLGGATEHAVTTGSDGSYAIDSSYFNESGLSSGFSAYLKVNAGGYLGATQLVKFSGSDYPVTQDFSLREP